MFSRPLICALCVAAFIALFGVIDRASAQTCYLPANVADANPDQIDLCADVILKKDKRKHAEIHQHASCESIYQAMLEEAEFTRAQEQIRRDDFCSSVVVWHQRNYYRGKPYWSSCLENGKPGRDPHPIYLSDCIKGYLSYQKEHGQEFKVESCADAVTAYNNGRDNGTIEFRDQLPRVEIGCFNIWTALEGAYERQSRPAWLKCTGYFVRQEGGDPEHFHNCMAADLSTLNTCEEARELYEKRLVAAHGRLPTVYEPLSCEQIDGFILAAKPRKSETPAKLQDETTSSSPVDVNPGAADEAEKPNSVRSSMPSDSYVLIALMLSAFVFLLSQRLAKAQLNKHGYKTNAFQSDIAEIVRTFAIFFSVLSLTSLLQRATGIDLLTPFTAIINLYRSSIEALIPDFLWNIGLPKWYADLVSFSLIAASPRLRNALDFAFFHDRRENEIWTDHEVAVRYMNFYHPGFSLVHFLEMDKDEDPVALDPRSKFVSDALTTLLTALLGLSWLLTIKRNFHNTFWLSKIYKYHLFTEWESSELRDGRQTIPGGLVGWFHLKYVWLPMILPPLITAMLFYATRVFA